MINSEKIPDSCLLETGRQGVYLVDLEAANKSSKFKEACKKAAKISSDFTFVILDNGENGYWTYLVICNNPKWQGNKGFLFTGVGAALGLIRHILSLCNVDTKKDSFFKKYTEFFDLFSAQISNFGTIIGYSLQNFTDPTNALTNYIGIGIFASSSLAGITLALVKNHFEKLQEEDPEKFYSEASKLKKFFVSEKFKRLEKIYEFFLNGLFGASFAYYFLDVLDSASVNVGTALYNGTQIACAITYAGITAMGSPAVRLTTDSIYMAVRSWYTLFVIAMDAEAEKTNDNISNAFFYSMLGVTAFIGIIGAVYYFFKEKNNYYADQIEHDLEQPALNQRWHMGEQTRLLSNSRHITFPKPKQEKPSNSEKSPGNNEEMVFDDESIMKPETP